MLSQDAYEAMLGIEEKLPLSPEKMADGLNITIFPYDEDDVSKNVASFVYELRGALEELKVNIVPYEKSLYTVPLFKTVRRFLAIIVNNFLFLFFQVAGKETNRIFINWAVLINLLRRRRIKPGIAVIAVGEGVDGKLPIDYTSSFRQTLVATVLDKPKHISRESTFHEHFDTSMELFAKNMTNVVLAVDEQTWTVYNFNASHPTYERGKRFKEHVLYAFISKAAAPMQPQRLKDFEIIKKPFNINNELYTRLIEDFKNSGRIFERIGLYPKGKKIDDLPFRNTYYQWIGKIHLDHRSGMSYGFLAWQLPTSISIMKKLEEVSDKIRDDLKDDDYAFDADGNLHILMNIPSQGLYVIAVPIVTVLTQRSGCDKTNFIPDKDLLQMGIKNGRMFMQTPGGTSIPQDYRPSFDTKVILAHSLGNAIAASVLKTFNPNSEYVKQVEENGVAISHWHGYINPEYIPKGWYVHGYGNPHVACSTPQSAIFGIDGKLNALNKAMVTKKEFKGDIHIEPHHGTNINFPTLTKLANYFEDNTESVSLGNAYFKEQ